MNRKMIVVAVTGVALVGGFAGQSTAAPDDSKRICLSSSWDPSEQGAEPLCVWIPGEADQ